MPTAITNAMCLAAFETIIKINDPKAKFMPGQVLGIEDGEDAAIFRSDLDDSRVHCWTFNRSSLGVKRVGDVDYSLAHAARTRRADKTWSFEVKLYLGYRTGTKLASARTELDELIDKTQNEFFKRPKLGLANENLKQHDDLQIIAISKPSQQGDQKVFIVTGRLTVHLYESIDAASPV